MNELLTISYSHKIPSVYTYGEAIEEAKAFYLESLNCWQGRINPNDTNLEWQKQCIEYAKAAQDHINSIKVVTFEEFTELEKQAWLTKPTETTKEIFTEMLEVLPPMKWEFQGKNNWFLISEHTSGVYTSQYAKINGKYYHATVNAYDRSTWIYNNL